jgi:hypothetical protein
MVGAIGIAEVVILVVVGAAFLIGFVALVALGVRLGTPDLRNRS